MTPIKLVQTYVDAPIYGDKIREPMISKVMTIAPQMNTVPSSTDLRKVLESVVTVVPS